MLIYVSSLIYNVCMDPDQHKLYSVYIRESVKKRSMELINESYRLLFDSIKNPANEYREPQGIVPRTPDQVMKLLHYWPDNTQCLIYCHIEEEINFVIVCIHILSLAFKSPKSLSQNTIKFQILTQFWLCWNKKRELFFVKFFYGCMLLNTLSTIFYLSGDVTIAGERPQIWYL